MTESGCPSRGRPGVKEGRSLPHGARGGQRLGRARAVAGASGAGGLCRARSTRRACAERRTAAGSAGKPRRAPAQQGQVRAARARRRCAPRARKRRHRFSMLGPRAWGPSDARCASAPQPSAAHERAAGAYCGTPRAARHERRVGRGASRQSRGPRRSSPSGLFPGRRSGAWRPRASRSAAGRSRAAGARRAFAAAAARACACAASGCLASRSGAAAACASAAACARPARLLGAQQRV